MLDKEEVEQVRRFNRQYTRVLGVFNRKIFGTDLSWAEARILIEIGVNHLQTPMMLARQLQIDKSYVSRTVNKLVKAGILTKTPSPSDSRSVQLDFTPAGRKVLEQVNQQSNNLVASLLKDLSSQEQAEFFNSVVRINHILFERK